MTSEPRRRALAPLWAEAVSGVHRSPVQRRRTERMIQGLRYGAILLALGLTLSVGGGPGGGLWGAIALLVGTSAAVEQGLRRQRSGTSLRRLGMLAFAGDTAATMVTLALVSEDPTDPVVTLAVILGLEAAVRWQLIGAVVGGTLGGALATVWFSSAYVAMVGSRPPPEYLLFRFASTLLMAVLVGSMVRQLERARHRAATVLELTPELVMALDRTGRITSANPAATRLLGYRPEELLGRPWHRLAVSGPADPDALAEVSDGGLVHVQLAHARHGPRWFELSVGDEPAGGRCYLIGRDITDRLHAERERSVSEQRYRALFAHNLDAVFALDLDARIVDVNPAAEILLHRPSSALVGGDVLAVVASDDRDHARRALGRTLTGEAQDVEVTLTFPDGSMGHADANLLPIIIDDEVVGVFGMARDVTERRRREASLEYRASHDLLTGLANRATLLHRLEQACSDAVSHAVLFLDLDGFKAVNDTHGHAAGDRILIEVARRLRAAVRGQDLACRFAGDEFCILLSPGDRTSVQRVGQRIAADLAAPIALDDRQVSVGASIGAVVVQAGEDAAAALARADAAMYAVKAQRRTPDGLAPDLPVLLVT